MNWRIKYMIQRSLSLLPGNLGRSLNHSLSVKFGGLKRFQFYSIDNTLAMSSLLRSLGFDPRDKTFVELGTGWSGTAAMILLGLSAREVSSFDLYRHLEQALVELSLKRLTDIKLDASMKFPFPCCLQEESALLDPSKIDLSHLRYFAPHDARATGLEENTIDCYFSLGNLCAGT